MGDQSGNLRQQLIKDKICSRLEETKPWIRQHCQVQFLVIENGKERTIAEHLMLAVLQPRYADEGSRGVPIEEKEMRHFAAAHGPTSLIYPQHRVPELSMPKEIFPSSYECDCGHLSHFFENTVRDAKEMSQRRTVRLSDSEAEEHTIVFQNGRMVDVLCPKRTP